jgi:hypothetical protein
MYSEMFPHTFVNEQEIKYVDIMNYVLFAKAVVEVGYKVYTIIFNHKFVPHEIITHTNESQENIENTNESQEIKDILEFKGSAESRDLKLSAMRKCFNEDIIHTNRYDKIDSKILLSSCLTTSCPDKTYLEQFHFFMKKENEGLSVETANMVTPWFNPSKRGPITMDLDNKLDTYKPFNNTSFEKVKAYDDDETLDVMTPTVSFVDANDTIIESNYENCIIEQSKQIKKSIENKIVIKIVPDHFPDIMTKNTKDPFTPSSSEYVNKKALQTLRHVP